MAAYYNEIEPFAARWLRNLIAAGHIAPGDVDERSIEDVRPDDLKGYTQCHFFAGVGVWSLALRRAGWEDSRPIWTGSCPCQPFSASGKQSGFADERHLWPHWYWLIGERRPADIVGEQVASKAAEPWLDLVQADLEAMDYAFGCVPFPSASIGAPHIRDRAYWVAHSDGMRQQRVCRSRTTEKGVAEPSETLRLADGDCQRLREAGNGSVPGGQAERAERDSNTLGLADANGILGEQRSEVDGGRYTRGDAQPRPGPGSSSDSYSGRPSPTNGFWGASDWLHCRDGKWRPVEPGTFPLVDGPAQGVGRVQPALARLYGRNRTGRLKGYGNAINADAASAFAATVRSILDEQYPTA